MYLFPLLLVERSEVEINIVHRHSLPLLKLISTLPARGRLYLNERALLLVQGGVLAVRTLLVLVSNILLSLLLVTLDGLTAGRFSTSHVF